MALNKEQLKKAQEYFDKQQSSVSSFGSRIKTVEDYYNSRNQQIDEEQSISGISGDFIDKIKNRYKQKGLLGGTAENINAAYEGYKELPVVKQVTNAFGEGMRGVGKVVGGATGGVAQAGYNVLTGRPLTEGVVEQAKKSAEETGDFGYTIGKEGSAAAPLGAAGRIPNALMAGAQIYEGGEGLANAETPEDYVNAGVQLGTGIIGAKGAKTGKGKIFNPEVTKPIKNAILEKIPQSKYVVKPVESIVKPSIEKTKNLVNKTGEKVGDAISPIEGNVKTELTKTSIPKEQRMEAYNRYIDQAEKAKVDNSQATPLELAGNRGEEALKKLKDQLTTAGKAKEAALQEHGTKTVSTKDTKKLFESLLEKRLGTKINAEYDPLLALAEKQIDGEVSTKGRFFNNAKGRKSIIENSPSDTKLVKIVNKTINELGENPTLQEVNDAIDGIQGELYKGKTVGAEPINGRTEAVVKEVIKNLNDKAKDVGGDAYKQANAEYSTKREIYETLNKALGVEGNRGAALMKQLFSPSGTMPRKLFTAIKEATGIDLVNEATLAKFAMESVGDARQASLLNEVLRGNVPLSKSGVVGKVLEYGVNKLQNPIKRGRKIIEKSK